TINSTLGQYVQRIHAAGQVWSCRQRDYWISIALVRTASGVRPVRGSQVLSSREDRPRAPSPTTSNDAALPSISRQPAGSPFIFNAVPVSPSRTSRASLIGGTVSACTFTRIASPTA